MDEMDVDHVADVPDTPDRLTAQNRNGKMVLDRRSNLSICGLENCNLLDGASKSISKVNDTAFRKCLDRACSSSNFGSGNPSSSHKSSTPQRRATDVSSNVCNHFMSVKEVSGQCLLDGASKSMSKVNDIAVRKASDRASFIPRVSGQCSSSNFDSGNPSSSNKSSTSQRRATDDVSINECNHFMSAKDYNKMASAQSCALEGGPIVEPKECIGARKKNFPCGAPGISRAEKNGKKLLSVIRSSSHSNVSSPVTPCFANKGKEAENTVSGFNHGNIVNCADNSHPKVDNGKIATTSLTLSSNTTHRVTGQKRLVRNGCISPLNIARAKESVGKEKMESDLQLTLPVASCSPLNKVGGKEWNTNDLESLKSKGKGVMLAPLKVKEPEAQSDNLASRNSVSIKEIVNEVDGIDGVSFRSSEALGGWRSTRNRSKLISSPLFHVLNRGETGSGAGISPMDLDVTSSENASLPSVGQRASHRRPELGQFVGHHPAVNELTKRQKQQLTSRSNAECSRAALDSSDIVFLGSSGNSQRTCETRSRNHLDSLVPVIEIDEVSPAARCDGSSNQGSNSNDAGDMAKLIEADEMLARELQEQLYNEVASAGVGELDAHLAMALQQGYDLSPNISRRRYGSNTRRSSVASSSRQPQSSSPPILSRRSYQSRAPTANRIPRFRNRFPGRPRTLSLVGERDSLFPAEMDVDLRMHILEALEAINDMGVDHSLLQTQRDFNENDYEMLLALDENNDRHGGASISQINGLPQSTVQTDNLEEACAICLDTPSLGDVIRHLPCLHKFHKDCIDPWLKRKTSCPVCKSSIT